MRPHARALARSHELAISHSPPRCHPLTIGAERPARRWGSLISLTQLLSGDAAIVKEFLRESSQPWVGFYFFFFFLFYFNFVLILIQLCLTTESGI